MPLTPEQFNKLVTKDYFEEKLAEKLKDLATKEDFKKLGEKMDKKFDAAYDMFAAKEDIKELKREMATKEDVNKILTAVDGIAHKHQGFEVEMTANLGAHDRLGKKIDGHEIRLKKLELPA